MTSKANITCLCGQSDATVTLATESLPEETHLCHCDICRYTSGVLCAAFLTLADPPEQKPSLLAYTSSKNMERHFCGTCGAHVFLYDKNLHEWLLASGVIETSNPARKGAMLQITKPVGHEYVASTVDGGLALCLEEIRDRKLDFYAQTPNREPLKPSLSKPSAVLAHSYPESERELDSKLATEEYLYASCHCGGVQFRLSTPDARSHKLHSPWPDLLVPYHSSSSKNDEDVKWWLRANDTKYLAGTCACRSCRLASGFPIQTWAFIPKVNITTMDAKPLSFTFGTLRQFMSSPGVHREFCSGCGATVFWHCDERPDLIDVIVGLLRAKQGSRAEEWLEWWTERVSFKEDAIDVELIDALEEGLPCIANG